MDTIRLDDANRFAVAERAASILARGGVVATPTDTLYGLLADALRDGAVRKVLRMKVRSRLKALPVFVRDFAQARECAYVDRRVDRLLAELWPGQTTVVLRKRSAVPDVVTGGLDTVGLRVPDYPFLAVLLEMVAHPLTATSANLSGAEPAASAEEVIRTFRHRVPRPDLVVDGGALAPSPPSTVLDLTNPNNPHILRLGAITKEELDEVLTQWSGEAG